MTPRAPPWDATIDAGLALLIASAVTGVLGFGGLVGSAAGSPGSAAYVLLALALVTLTWAVVRAARRVRVAGRAPR
jgi:uncharacterized membrane protein YtjA (UPF0391 family)